ncbi:MAG: FAD-dependent oxidoreductase, partial [Gammaproteobacteria bacterium]|nr:FAD-dependent oxidoreductase [Gammaproteobacteria bacterium]
DCLGTSHRQGAKSITSLEIMPRPPVERAGDNPWPEWPRIFRTASAHEEGGERLYSVSTRRFVGDDAGHVRALELVDAELVNRDGRISFEEVAGSNREIPADLVLLAMGFTGPEQPGLLETLKLELTDRGNVKRDARWMTSVPGVFTAGDMQHGQSLIVWAIAEGRSAARAVDEYLMGHSDLPAPV